MMSVVIPLGGGMQCGASHFSTMVGPMCIKVTERREAHFHHSILDLKRSLIYNNMETDCAHDSIYAQFDKLEQNLDSELHELQGYLQNSQSNKVQESDIDDDVDSPCKFDESFKAEASGYNQTCIVKTTTSKICHGETGSRETFYRTGKHCYRGEIELDLQQTFDTTLDDIPVVLSMLEQQQSNFTSFKCDSDDLPEDNSFRASLHELEKAQHFLKSEISSEGLLSADIAKLEPSWKLYFELVGDTHSLFPDVLFACSRVHSKGHIIIFLYYEGVLYAAIQDDEIGDDSLLGVNFPAYFRVGNEGSTLAMYNDTTWMKLSAWKRPQSRNAKPESSESGHETISNRFLQQDLVSDGYSQSYYILKPDSEGKEREVMFRFGAWFYSGRVDLPTTTSLQEIPGVIRQVRLSQHKLEYVGDDSSLPVSNKFVKPMQYSTHITECMKEEAVQCSELYLSQIMSQADANKEGKHWLEDDANTCFFEFACSHDAPSQALETLELVCNKVYNASGVITISIYHDGNWYLVLEETGGEYPLLDSRFPDLSRKRIGCQLKTYPRGNKSWAELRSLSLWRPATLPRSTDIVSGDGSTQVVNKTKQSNTHGYLRSLLPRSPLRWKNS